MFLWILHALKKPLGKLAMAVDMVTLEAIWLEPWWWWKLRCFEVDCSPLHLRWCRRHIPAALQMAVSCSVRDFARYCALKRKWYGGLEHSRRKGQSNRRRPDGVVCVNLRELCSNRYNFHHVAQLVSTKWSVFLPNGVFLFQAWFWILEKRWARWI